MILISKECMLLFIFGFIIWEVGLTVRTGRFNRFDGTFSYDEQQPDKSSVSLWIAASSIDTNHAERDKHSRGEAYFRC